MTSTGNHGCVKHSAVKHLFPQLGQHPAPRSIALVAGFLTSVFVLAYPLSAKSQQLEANKASKATPASKITYSNSKSGLKAKSVQGALDEVGTKLSAILSGKARSARVSSTATSTTWKGSRYFYINRVSGKFGPPETLQNAPVTMTFTPASDSSGTLTVTPINFFCEIEFLFDELTPAVCGTYGDIFSYSYKIFGTNLFVENGRTSAGELIGEGVLEGAGTGEQADIQSQGPTRLVLKYVGNSQRVAVWDLTLNN